MQQKVRLGSAYWPAERIFQQDGFQIRLSMEMKEKKRDGFERAFILTDDSPLETSKRKSRVRKKVTAAISKSFSEMKASWTSQ